MKRKILPSSKGLLAFFTLLALFISCRKNEVAGPAKGQSKEELQKAFFNTSTTNDTEIQKLAANIQKQKFLLNSLPEFVRKNGIPKWDKVLYKTQQTTSGQQTLKTLSGSLKTNTVSSNGANQGVFFIPLQDENSKQVKSYITVYKHNDSLYTYRLYNKDSLNTIRPGSSTTKKNLLNTQAVFGYFEKTINNTDSVNVLSPTKATLKNVKINFDTPTNTNSVNGTGVKTLSGDGCLVAMSVTIEYTITFWSDGSYSESVSVSMSIAFDCSGGGGGGSGDFGDGTTTYQTPFGGNYWWSYGTGWPYYTGGSGNNNNDPNYNYAGGPSGYFDPNWYWWWTSIPVSNDDLDTYTGNETDEPDDNNTNDNGPKAFIPSQITLNNGQTVSVIFGSTADGSANQQVSVRLINTLIQALNIASQSVQISSIYIKATTNGNHTSAASNHFKGTAIDISRINGTPLIVQGNSALVQALQSAFDQSANIRENFGPTFKHKLGVPYSVGGHADHIHVSINGN